MGKKRAVVASASKLRVAELFAGVGGFHLGFAAAGHETVWANQWEPSTKVQHAADVYRYRFPDTPLSNEDIAAVVERLKKARGDGYNVVPDFDLLCGGFPCQDYSVAKPAPQASGIEGKKGVLWWQIYELARIREPRFIVLENVDRLLKSPTAQRGRDFAIILACLNDLGYTVEWRVINAAEYGFPQRRRRVFIFAYKPNDAPCDFEDAIGDGVFARAFPIKGFTAHPRVPRQASLIDNADSFAIEGGLHDVTKTFGEAKQTRFQNAGVARDRKVWTARTEPAYEGPFTKLGDILQPDDEVPEEFFIDAKQLDRWRYLKGAKSELRTTREGFAYEYSEGGMVFPDARDMPSRTILTGEGGSSPSRFKHVVHTLVPEHGKGSRTPARLRRLTPIELERLNGFPDDHTLQAVGDVSPARRAFLMGNALVVGLAEAIAQVDCA